MAGGLSVEHRPVSPRAPYIAAGVGVVACSGAPIRALPISRAHADLSSDVRRRNDARPAIRCQVRRPRSGVLPECPHGLFRPSIQEPVSVANAYTDTGFVPLQAAGSAPHRLDTCA